MAKVGGSLGKKPQGTLIGTVTQEMGTGRIKGMSTRKNSGSLKKSRAPKQSRGMRPQVVDVYGSGGSGGSSGRYGRSGGSGRSGRGGYSGGGGGSSSYDRQMALEEARFAWEKEQAAAAKKEEAARRYAGKVANRASYENHLAMIDAAIRNAKNQYKSDVNLWDQRGRDAKADVRSLFGSAINSTMAGNEATTDAIAGHAAAAKSTGQSVIDAIANRNEQTVEGLEGNLDAMGLGQGLQSEVGGVSEALALAEMQARSDQANVGANFGLQQGAQQAIGNWNVSGFRGDQATAITDISRNARDIVFELQRTLQNLLAEQQQERLRALGEYEARKAELSY